MEYGISRGQSVFICLFFLVIDYLYSLFFL